MRRKRSILWPAGAAALVLLAIAFLVLDRCARKGAPDAADIAANNRGVGLMGRFEYAAALDIFAALAEKHPEWVDVKVNQSIATLNRQQEGDEVRALQLLDEAIALDPDNVRARYCAGLLLFRTADERALPHLRFVAEADPADPYALYFHGSALEQEGRVDEALALYRRALELDPYLRSAVYRVSRLLLRSGRTDEGLALQEEFQKLADNPRARTVDFIYTKMGRKAEALAIDLARPAPRPRPAGPVFAEAGPLLDGAGAVQWNDEASARPAGVTACDLNGDGRLDLFLAGALGGGAAFNAVAMAGETGFALDTGHPLAAVGKVNAALFGDYDNDGLTDAYLCRNGPNQLWRQHPQGSWTDVTSATGTAGGSYDTVDGAFFDADHDGDLDLFCVNADGPNDLLNNNLDGTFRSIAAEQGIAGDGRPSRQVLVCDLDGDRDADIAVIKEEPPNDVYLNDRLWRYRPAEGFDALRTTPIRSAVHADLDADGRVEVFARRSDGSIAAVVGAGAPAGPAAGGAESPLAVADTDGDGTLELLTRPYASWAPVVLDPGAGPAVVGTERGAAPVIERPGPGRHPFAALRLSGMTDAGQSMRSNASGIGARIAARVDSRWTITDTFRSTSGPGQSLQPVAIGLGGAPRIDFVSIDWSDGVFQSEVGLAGGALHVIRETQRQLSSCPVLFAWDGTTYRFVSDLLGVGGIGYMVAPGAYAEPRPRESFLLPDGLLRPRGGRYVLKLGEPMEEACYLDAAALVAWDVPPGWRMVLDERMGIGGPAPTGEPRFYRSEIAPGRAVNDRGQDVTEELASADLRAAPPGSLDLRFIGRLAAEHVLTLEFAAPLTGRGGEPILVADGWIEYPYSQTMFASWQAGAGYAAPTIEARGADGTWHTVLEHFGYPAGMPRSMSVPLPGLPGGTTALRLRSNQEIYWDRLALAFAEPCPQAVRRVLPLADARVNRCGFPRRTTGAERQPHYDYGVRSPFWDTHRHKGFYTEFGPAAELVSEADGALAIFGAGEEAHLEFDATLDEPPPGWSRRFVLEAHGWCKDMDLYTKDGETVEPLPAVHTLHERYNTRFEQGP